jgi:hypothetical protein
MTERRTVGAVTLRDVVTMSDVMARRAYPAREHVGADGVHGTLTYERDPLGNPLMLSLPQRQRIGTLYHGSGHVHQMRFNDAVIADFERDDLHREIVRTQGKLGFTQLTGRGAAPDFYCA